MNKNIVGILAVGLMASAIFGGCKGDDSSPRSAQKGEACQTTSDCAGSLSCVPRPGAGGGGVCVTGEFKVAPTAKECAVIQCTTPIDCCPRGVSNCDSSRYTCTSGTCGSVQCTSDSQCFGGSCVAGQCTECSATSSCPSGETCQSGLCRPACTSDSECPSFNRCTDGTCTEGGCQTDRECVAATHNVEATCGKDGKCVVACQTDIECGNPKDYSFYSCISGQCTYVGCASDKECELYMGGSGSGSQGRAVCRDKVAK